MIATRAAWRYGLLGLPLAFAALPLYVHMPARYATDFGMPLATLGAVLLGVRLFDAVLDPWIGRMADRLYARSPSAVLVAGALVAVLLAVGFAMLFFPPAFAREHLLAWAALSLVVTCTACSALTIAHQAWGAMLAGDETQRARIVGWREGAGLAGVLLAATLPTLAGWAATVAVLVAALAVGCFAWSRGARPGAGALPTHDAHASPMRQPAFRRLLAVFMLNGIATAVPATLLLFFVRDRLEAPEAMQPLFLGAYFLAGALSLPLWVACVRRFGLTRTWLAGMALAIATFGWAATLGAGDAALFVAICILSGLALGSDLAVPAALLAGVIQDAGASGQGEGAYFGWWQFATKLNLALAAGLALPLLGAFGYAPGGRSAEALAALTFAYCVLPCILKALAAGLLHAFFIRKGSIR